MKKYYIETYGCQMNFAQSVQLEKMLQKNGLDITDSPLSADFIIINACSVREHAEMKVFNRIDFFNSLKKQNNNIKLLVTGCFAQNNKEKINADIVMGSYIIKNIPSVLNLKANKKYVNVDMDIYTFLEPVPEDKFPFRSQVDITKGCNNFCSYCIVPYARGKLISRKSRDIISKIKKLSGEGVKEIILLGQNVNSFGKDNNDIDFSELLYEVNEIKGIHRIRFLTSHPKDFSEKIISSIFKNEKVVRYFHLPIQSGSDKILKLMNRKYDLEKYCSIIDKIDSMGKDYSISTDFLVGFPQETEEDFLQTIEAAKKIKFNTAFMFKYSSRPNIASEKYPDKVPEEEKKRRLAFLIDFQKKIEKEKIKDNLNKIRTVLIDRKSRKDKNKSLGRDELNYQVILDDNVEEGKFYNVLIRDISGAVLLGKKIDTRRKNQCA